VRKQRNGQSRGRPRSADDMARQAGRAVSRYWVMMECGTLSIWKSSDNPGMNTEDYWKKRSQIASYFQNIQKYRPEGWLTIFRNRKKVLHVEFVFLLLIELVVCLKPLFH
jgi:hypothetical protein